MKKHTEEEVNRFQPVGKTKLIHSSILAPENAGLRLVLSVANLNGKIEGDVQPLYAVFDKKWKKVKEDTKGWYNTRTGTYKLGAVNNTAVQSDTWVINMLCQDESLQVNTKGLEDCLEKVAKMAKDEKATVHVSTLLTDAIPELSDLLSKLLLKRGVSVYFYQEPA
jgi:hypothetical protein